ncbi:SWPV1-252 [Shearwaterpox virus]|uniref:SWPV1-252 n=1 Tax=Shearwaterpox virus TaxID=1974596 RepID=A0A1V0S853_CNPV|nr:SWPV1-252 [Shearwaterpox virus]
MISLPSSCQNVINRVINGECFFGKCKNKKLAIKKAMTVQELEYVQKWLLEKHDLFIEFPIELDTMEHILYHLSNDISTVKRKKSVIVNIRRHHTMKY